MLRKEPMASAYIMPILRIKTKGVSLPYHSQESIQYFHFRYFESKIVSKGLLSGLWHFFKKQNKAGPVVHAVRAPCS